MNNTRFATVIHMLTLMAKYPGQWLSSEWIAGSININPVMVRKELSLLQHWGWVQSKKGKEGGSMLQVPATQITLADIFMAVKSAHVLGKKNKCEEGLCPVGRNINKALQQLFDDADTALVDSLRDKTLADFVQEVS
ncbi:MAG TPA: Rrf2 family transcriptional regulator [Edaphocola sp.]|nr:Rrf2 family transcriptional regulator [Edaphocola sp.]